MYPFFQISWSRSGCLIENLETLFGLLGGPFFLSDPYFYQMHPIWRFHGYWPAKSSLIDVFTEVTSKKYPYLSQIKALATSEIYSPSPPPPPPVLGASMGDQRCPCFFYVDIIFLYLKLLKNVLPSWKVHWTLWDVLGLETKLLLSLVCERGIPCIFQQHGSDFKSFIIGRMLHLFQT